MNQAVPISVLIDDQALIAQVRGGISRNLIDFLMASRAINEIRIDMVTLGRWSGNEYAISTGLWRPWPNARLSKIMEKAEARFGPRPRFRPEFDIVHHTYYFDAYLDRKLSKKSVVSVYDMIPEIYPELFPAGNPHLAKHKFVSASSAVMCISERYRPNADA